MTSQSRALVVGFGSIGERHAQVLSGMGLDVGVVSRRQVSGYQGFSGLEAALESLSPAYVVVADETARHGETVRRIGQSGYAGTVLVEKPLLSSPAPLPKSDFAAMAVGYQLRFHPAVRALRARLAGEASVVAMLEVGQNLSQWRPGRDWRQGYSASRKAGGGVLRDLSHELDLMLWLFGPWRRLAALGGRGEALGVAADDTATVLVETARCPR